MVSYEEFKKAGFSLVNGDVYNVCQEGDVYAYNDAMCTRPHPNSVKSVVWRVWNDEALLSNAPVVIRAGKTEYHLLACDVAEDVCEMEWKPDLVELAFRVYIPVPEPVEPVDMVHNPKHYSFIEGVESIEVIACSLTLDEWRGFCMGNAIKYRLRAGKKDALQQDIDKANNYADNLFDKFKHLCRTVARR